MIVDSGMLAAIANRLAAPGLFLGSALPECHMARMRAHLVTHELGDVAVGDLAGAAAGESWAECFERLWGEPLGDAL